jgi:hypothetical protein
MDVQDPRWKTAVATIPRLDMPGGTGREELLERFQDASKALSDALRALSFLEPNRADYDDPASLAKAKSDYATRYKKIESVSKQVADMYVALRVTRWK